QARQFVLTRDGGHMVFTLVGAQGQPLTEAQASALPAEQRADIAQAEQELRTEIARFLDATRPQERARDEALATLRRQAIKPLLVQALDSIRGVLRKQIKDGAKLGQWLDQVQQQVLEQLTLF